VATRPGTERRDSLGSVEVRAGLAPHSSRKDAREEDAMAKGADKPNTNKSNKPKLSTKEKQEKKKAKKASKG
jgi:hypothetical protein